MYDIALKGNHIQGVGCAGTGLSGYISSGCSSKFLVDGVEVAIVGSITSCTDGIDSGSGRVVEGSSKIKINGIPVARLNNKVQPHCGSAIIIDGNPKVKVSD